MISTKPNVILVGFMASGKSRIGEMLAKRLAFDVVDVDDIIEREEKKSIAEIFREKGEWYFREREARTLKTLAHRINTVIITGGGAPIFFDNANFLRSLGCIFFLDASLSLIEKRLQTNNRRPLGKLVSGDDKEKLRELYAFRRPIYQRLGYSIDVNHEDKNKTCDEIISRYQASLRIGALDRTVVNDGSSNYSIFHEPGCLEHVDNIVATLGLLDHKPVIITSDKLTNTLHRELGILTTKLKITEPLITIADGEQHKNDRSIKSIHDAMFNRGLTRKTLVLALGGGNIGDVAGFASAIYLRGVPFLQIPTTLLAMVDASIGGKTGVDNNFGKNLLGAFHNPSAVLVDENVLQTLSQEDYACGMAEVIKHAIIADKELFAMLKNDHPRMSTIIKRALKVKADIVFNDPKENNIRAHLNLGHTFAHAIEKLSNYEIKHGFAVAMGLVLACKTARSLGVLVEDFESDLKLVLEKFSLPTTLPGHFAREHLIDAMRHDKKRDNFGLRLILPRKIGDVCVQVVNDTDILK